MTWVMWNLIFVYLETVFASVPYRCTVCAEHTIGSKIGLDAADGTLGDVGQVEYLISVCLDIVIILTQDRCAVCAERTMGSKVILDAPMELLGDMGLVESCFGQFWRQYWCWFKRGARFAPNIP